MTYKYADSRGVSIAYHEQGQGFPLLLLMGFGADGTVWQKHAAVYSKHFRCIIPDNRGVGKSDQPAGPYSTEMMADDAFAVLQHAGVTECYVAGISMGGAIAQELALKYPDTVKKLMLVSTWGKFNEYASAVYTNLKHIRSVVSPEYYMELLQLWIFAAPYYEKYRSQLQSDAAAYGANGDLQTRDGFEGQLDACIRHDSLSRLSALTMPTLITVGMMDIFTPPEFSYKLQENIAGSRLITFPEGGHVHHWEDLDRFNNETTHFLINELEQ